MVEDKPLVWLRPMPGIGLRRHELRIVDEKKSWRIVYRIDHDAIVIIEVFRKTTKQTPQRVVADCKRRLSHYDVKSREIQI